MLSVPDHDMKYVIVTGGVVSGLGKGITASSIGMLLKSHGYSVTAIKIDPYVNVDAGTMSPYEHGEVYVLDDGGETDLDLGNYERFLEISLRRDNNMTTGKVYQEVIEDERNGKYLGKTVQVVPHITDHIQAHIKKTAKIPVDNNTKIPDICIIELGGTLGDIESLPFLEALAQLRQDLPSNDYCFVHVSLIPTINSTEQKTKPTQHCVKSAKMYGINPDVLCLRSEKPISSELKKKLMRTCHLAKETAIITNHNLDSIYKVPMLFRKQKLDTFIIKKLGLKTNTLPNLSGLRNILATIDNTDLPTVTIGIIGKYTGMQDTYLTLVRALEHASFKLKVHLDIKWIDAETFETSPDQLDPVLSSVNGVLIPGGFGNRGIEGMVMASKWVRENGRIPLFGICLGMQIMLIDVARNVMGWGDANSAEFDPDTKHPIVKKSKKLESKMGGTMRLGLYDLQLHNTSLKLFQKNEETLDDTTSERHRHRYEVNNELFGKIRTNGCVRLGGESEDNVVEIIENVTATASDSVFSIGCQFHPEYKTKNEKPHWLFVEFLKSAVQYSSASRNN